MPRRRTLRCRGAPRGTREHDFGEDRRGAGAQTPPEAEGGFTPSTGELGHQSEVAGGPHDIANNPASADGEIGRYGLSWLKVFLEGDERYRQFLLETPSRQSDFRENL